MGLTADHPGSLESIRAAHSSVAPRRLRLTDASGRGAARSATRPWIGVVRSLVRSALAVLFVCAVLAPAARAFEWCPDGSWCPDGEACCPYPYGPGYWC